MQTEITHGQVAAEIMGILQPIRNAITSIKGVLAKETSQECPSKLTCDIIRQDLSNVPDSWDVYEKILKLLRERYGDEVIPPPPPDEAMTQADMFAYGYQWGGMYPVGEHVAKDLLGKIDVLLLYSDNTESYADDVNAIRDHTSIGGICGVEKSAWHRYCRTRADMDKENTQ